MKLFKINNKKYISIEIEPLLRDIELNSSIFLSTSTKVLNRCKKTKQKTKELV